MMKRKRKEMGKKITKTKPNLGARLRSARQQHGANLEAAAAVLHIPIKQLAALEENAAAEVFAAPVYAFGALRSYATWLGIDSRKLERELAAQLRAANVERSALTVYTLPHWYSAISARTVVAAAGVLLALLVGSYVVWQVRSFWRLPQLDITSPADAVTDADRVVVAGLTEEGAHVVINEQDVPLRDNNHFEQEIPLSLGVTIVRIQAENVAGRVRSIEKHLLRVENTGTLN